MSSREELIADARNYSARTGYGLASVWGHINKNEFAEARALLDELILMDIEKASGL